MTAARTVLYGIWQLAGVVFDRSPCSFAPPAFAGFAVWTRLPVRAASFRGVEISDDRPNRRGGYALRRCEFFDKSGRLPPSVGCVPGFVGSPCLPFVPVTGGTLAIRFLKGDPAVSEAMIAKTPLPDALASMVPALICLAAAGWVFIARPGIRT